MKKRRSIDPDGLDGILQPSDIAPSKPTWFRLLWAIPVVIVLGASVFWLQKPSQIPSLITTTQVQNPPSMASGQISKSPLDNKTPITPTLTDSPVSEAEVNSALENTTLLATHSKTSVDPALPAETPAVVSTSTLGNDVKLSTGAPFTVHFKLKASQMTPLSKAETSQLISRAKRCPNLVGVTGHTCNLGTDASNHKLGLARAAALKKLLITNGVAAKRIVTASEGMRKPAASNDTKSGQALNRRAELYCLEH